MRENFTINLLLPLLSSYLFFSVHSDVLAVAQKPSPAATWKLREPGRISSPWETELIENWKSFFVLTQNVPVMGFQGSNWMQFAAVKLCMVPPNASLSIPWVPVHGCQCHGHTQFHFTAALSVLSLSLSIWLAPGKVLHLPLISAFTSHPPTHLRQMVPCSWHQLHRMKIMLRRAVSPKLLLWMCVDPFACSHLGSLWCPPLPPFTPVPARSSRGVQSLLAMTSQVSVWQGHTYAAAQSPDLCQVSPAVTSQCTPNLCLCDQATDFYMDLLKMFKSWTW